MSLDIISELQHINFTDGLTLKHFLQSYAEKNGFKIFLKDSHISNRLRFFCSKQQIHHSVNKSTKPGCPFRLVFNKNSTGIYVISDRSNFNHSHPINIVNEQEIIDPVKDSVISMKEIGISNFQITMFIEKQFNVALTSKDISKIWNNQAKNKQISETELMENYMQGKGDFFIYENLNGIAGFLTLTYNEFTNFQRYGDFIVIDGTSIPNYLEWTIVPIAIQGNYGELLSGGVAFTYSENKDFYYWLVHQLHTINPKLIAIISDEDSGICPALDAIPEIVHILCSKHKISNIMKLVSPKNPDYNLFIYYVNTLFYSRSEHVADSAKTVLYQKFPEIIHYFEDNVFSIDYKLLSSKKPDVFLFNHTSSQLGESYNNMIKRDLSNSLKHLFEIRDHITKKFTVKIAKEEQIRRNAFIYHHFLIDNYHLDISKKICELIDAEIREVNNVQLSQANADTWIAKEGNEKYYLNYDQCQCHFTVQAGLPCRHIIALYKYLGNHFPVHLINRRFKLTEDPQNIPYPYYEESDDDDDIYQETSEDMSEDYIDSFSEDEDNSMINDFTNYLDYNDNILPRITDQINDKQKYYSELLQISKELSKIGSESTEKFEEMKKQLIQIKSKFTMKSQFGEVEVLGRRKGRPKLKGMSKRSSIK